MIITKNKTHLIVKIPLTQKENNCYMDEKNLGDVDNLIGVICGDEQGLAQVIDLSYKGTQQIGEFIVYTDLKRDDFIKLCKDLSIGFYEYPVCVKCYKPIFGCRGVDDKGKPLCFDCEKL